MKNVMKVLVKYLNLKGLLMEYLYDDLLVGAIDKLVAKTDNTLDDGIANMLKPMLRAELEGRLDAALAELAAE